MLWRLLQESGWKYKRGPEPYEKVYVPPDGTVSVGSVLGKDFFHADEQLWNRAEELGIIDKDSTSDASEDDGEKSDEPDTDIEDKPIQKLRKNPVCVSSPECEANEAISTTENLSVNNNDHSAMQLDAIVESLDNTELCGLSFAVTKKSAAKCSHLVASFLSMEPSERKFMKDLWVPFWNCIKVEQGSGDNGLSWRYDKSRGAGELGRDFWYCPPRGVLGAKGEFGKDYFTNEEEVVSFLLRDLKALGETPITEKSMNELVTNFELKLSRAIENHLSFDEVDSSLNGLRRKRSPVHQVRYGATPTQQGKKLLQNYKFPDAHPNEPCISQTAIEGAEILLGLTKNNVNENPAVPVEVGCVATPTGIKQLLKFRSINPLKKRKSPVTCSQDEPPKKKGKSSPDNHKFHLTQADDDVMLKRWVSPVPKTITKRGKLPFDGFCFFGSGIDVSVADAVSRLGGKFLKEVKGDALKTKNVVKKLFFLSDIINRRTHKYILACALGVPMLHFKWVYAVEKQYEEYVSQKEELSNIRAPSVFDSQLYSAYR